MSWQQAHVQAAAVYLRERILEGATDQRTRAVYEGLLEVLDPSRRATRLQRELAESAKTVPVDSSRERRVRSDRRAAADRRRTASGGSVPGEVERRSGRDRRNRTDRRER